MTIEECLRQFMIDDYGSVKRFAESIGLPPTTVYNVLTRGISGSGFEIVQKIYNTLGLHYTVRGFETDYDYENLRAKRDEYLNKRNGGFVEVPLLGHIAAGIPIEMDVVETTVLCPAEIRRRHPNAFFLTVDGESMNNVLPNGCYALVDPEKKSPVVDGTAYAVCVNGYDATIKRIKQLENGMELIPDSKDPTFHAQVYDKTVEGTESITIIGEVVWYSIPFDFKI
mgnify:CR=1 FL=1|jgi:repressor LexA